jgi:hypothetical protein
VRAAWLLHATAVAAVTDTITAVAKLLRLKLFLYNFW